MRPRPRSTPTRPRIALPAGIPASRRTLKRSIRMATFASSGLDAGTLELTLDAISEFAARHLPEARLLELDHLDECPLDIVRNMCSDDLGIQLLFIPEEYGGMGGGTFDVY